MYREQRASSGGIGIASVLAIIFVVLKLVGVISWSWWWVLSPIWITWGILLIVICIVAIVLFVRNHSDNRKGNKWSW